MEGTTNDQAAYRERDWRLVQEGLSHQIARMDTQLAALTAEMNTPGGIKETLLLLREQGKTLERLVRDVYGHNGDADRAIKPRLTAIFDRVMQISKDIYGEPGHSEKAIRERVNTMHDRYLFLLCLVKWLAGIVATLCVAGVLWGTSELWFTRDTVRQMLRQQPGQHDVPAPPKK